MKIISSLSVMVFRVKRLLLEEYDSNDADFSLELIETTTDGIYIG